LPQSLLTTATEEIFYYVNKKILPVALKWSQFRLEANGTPFLLYSSLYANIPHSVSSDEDTK
jgi:hypothetical protein